MFIDSKELMVFITAALPVSELRGAIPLGLLKFDMDLQKVLILSILGNLAPIPFILFLLEPVSKRLRNIGIFKKFFDWLFERTKRKAQLIERYEFLGLILFVAIPLPMTGAWTGSIAASLFKLRFRYAMLGVTLGVLIAATVVSFLTTLAMK